MIVYADTSFLVSLYVLDANSGPASGQMKRVQLPMLLSSLCELELLNAIRLRQFRREITASNAAAASTLFTKDVEAGIFKVVALSAATFDVAKRLARQHTPQFGTRTLDVLHVASALVLKAHTFLTFDRSQANLAKALHLAVF